MFSSPQTKSSISSAWGHMKVTGLIKGCQKWHFSLSLQSQKLETPLATTSVEEKPRHTFQDIKTPHVFVQEVFEDASGEPVDSHAQEQSSFVCSKGTGEDEKPSTPPQEHSSHSPTASVSKFTYPQQQSKDEAPRKSLSPSRSLITEV